ncbi:MAG TPA: magnesium/cobalt transporter CorA [Chitinophagales bacterium]|nr:magnesium/cobalt transporter CorA [Chitinophagales bacterium]
MRTHKHLKRPTRTSKTGLPPGRMVYIGDQHDGPVKVSVFDYDSNDLVERELKQAECESFRAINKYTWLNVDGLHDLETIECIGKRYNVHPLVMEDIVNTQQRPKVEDYGDYLYIVLKMLEYDYENSEVVMEQMSFILGSDYVISFQEIPGDTFDAVRTRLRSSSSRFRQFGPDYLLYALMDRIVDDYFIVMEKLGEELEEFEELIYTNPNLEIAERLNKLRRNSIYVRKSVWPLREMVNHMSNGDYKQITKRTRTYMRDLYDHTVQVLDTVETYRDIQGGIKDVYQSNLNLRMNEVMKVLTIISTIFIPLNFIAGVYGMNFEFMPELQNPFGYFIILGFMMGVAILMLTWFKLKKWF